MILEGGTVETAVRLTAAGALALGEALTQAGITAGLPPALAEILARATVAGSGELLYRASEDAATLRRNVTSPGGTTAAAAPTEFAKKANEAYHFLTVAQYDQVRALEAHRRKQAEQRKPDWPYWGHVFLTSEGNLYHGAEVLKAWKVACRKAGVRERRFHDIRHASATIMRDAGVAEETRQSRMGHSTTAMSRRYAKASETQDKAAAAALAEAIG